MKKPDDNQKKQFVVAVYADDKKGLLHEVLMYFNRKNYLIGDLNISRSDIKDLVMISLEVEMCVEQLGTIVCKLENIIEVYKVIAFAVHEVPMRKVAFFRMSNEAFTSALLCMLQGHGASIVDRTDDSFVVQKSGSDSDISKLYAMLEGKNLISFLQSGLIAPKHLITFDCLFQEEAQTVNRFELEIA